MIASSFVTILPNEYIKQSERFIPRINVKYADIYLTDKRLPDCSEKPGEDLCVGLCRTCNISK